jgi:hypothetical protein
VAIVSPTFVLEAETSWTTTNPASLEKALAVVAGERITVLAIDEQAAGTLALAISGGGLTWKEEKLSHPEGECYVVIWTATAAKTETITIKVTATGKGQFGNIGRWGFNALAWKGSEGIGAVVLTTGSGAPLVKIKTGQDNSALVVVNADFAAKSGSTRKARPIAEPGKAVTCNAATDVFTCTAHGYRENDEVQFSGLTGGAGITAGTIYYVIASGLAANEFKVSATLGGTALNVTSNLTAGTVARTYAEQTYSTTSGAYTVYGGFHGNVGAAGEKEVGFTEPTGQTFTAVAIEVKGTKTAEPPSVTTEPATEIGLITATFNGTVDPKGLSTTYWFEYGTDTKYGSTTEKVKGLETKKAVSAKVTGLLAGQTYHFRLVAENSAGITYGLDSEETEEKEPVKETPTPGGADAKGTAPVASAALVQDGATATGSQPALSVPVAAGGAPASGTEPKAQESATETPVPGGSTASGIGPQASVAGPQGGSLAGGAAPASAVPSDSGGALGSGNGVVPDYGAMPIAGEAQANGDGPSATAAVLAGGAVADGASPTERQAASPPPGGAIASGQEPTAASTAAPGEAAGAGAGPTAATSVAIGGASAGGIEPQEAEEESASLPSGGAEAGGSEPSTAAQADSGGASAGGPGPGAAASPALGGAQGDGITPATITMVGQGGAIAAGNAPSEHETTVEAAIPGGALANGTGPQQAVASGIGGAEGAGLPGSAGAACGRGEAEAAGQEPGSHVLAIAVAGGADGGWNPPVALIALGPRGLAQGDGSSPSLSALVESGGALAAGYPLEEITSGTVVGTAGLSVDPAGSASVGDVDTGAASLSATPAGASSVREENAGAATVGSEKMASATTTETP